MIKIAQPPIMAIWTFPSYICWTREDGMLQVAQQTFPLLTILYSADVPLSAVTNELQMGLNKNQQLETVIFCKMHVK